MIDESTGQMAANAFSEIFDRMHPILTSRANPRIRPDVLYHFTDVGGMLGVCQNGTLWASLATSLNDATEVLYATKLAAEICAAGLPGVDRRYLHQIGHYLRTRQWIERFRLEIEPFVVSFCARADLALQWLHYGRSGKGVALGFTGAELEQSPYDLIPVLYDRAEQENLLKSVISTAYETITSQFAGVPSEIHEPMLVVASHIAAQYILAVAAQLKDPAFAGEEEWRLLTMDFTGEGIPVPKVPTATHFRSVSTRVVPYKTFQFSPMQIREIILGYGVSMLQDDPALAVLFRRMGYAISVARSAVRVRE
jgi:hypothetical protein